MALSQLFRLLVRQMILNVIHTQQKSHNTTHTFNVTFPICTWSHSSSSYAAKPDTTKFPRNRSVSFCLSNPAIQSASEDYAQKQARYEYSRSLRFVSKHRTAVASGFKRTLLPGENLCTMHTLLQSSDKRGKRVKMSTHHYCRELKYMPHSKNNYWVYPAALGEVRVACSN